MEDYSVALHLTLAPYQRRDYSKLLIRSSVSIPAAGRGQGGEQAGPEPQAAHTDEWGCCVPSPGLSVKSPGGLARNKCGPLPRFSPFGFDSPDHLH